MRALLLAVALVVVAFVAAMPNVFEFEMEELEKIGNFIQTKEDLVDFITEGQKASKQSVKLKSFSYNDCGGPNAMVHISKVSVTPDPLVFPGPLNLLANFQIMNDIGTPMAADLLIQKKVLGKYITLPCIDNFGSCHYDNLWDLIATIQCPDPIVKIGINCTCPLKAGTYMLPETKIDVGVAFLPKGDYHARGNVTFDNKVAACLDIVLTFG